MIGLWERSIIMAEQVVLRLLVDSEEIRKRFEKKEKNGSLEREARQIAELLKRLRESQILTPEKLEKPVSI